jgi:tetratricopeptide (TPR) repeat protein
VELPTTDYPAVLDQVWLVSEGLPPAGTGARADIVLLFSQEDPAPSWAPGFFNEYRSEVFRLGDVEGRRITGVNKESLTPELVVLARIGDRYLTALSNGGEAAQAHFEKGVRFFHEGRLDLAVEQLESAIEKDPDHALSHYQLGLCFASQGRPVEARRELERYLELTPEGAEVDGVHRILEYLRPSE